MKLLTEFRRRQVFKVGAAYAVVGWLLIQAASILFETFGAPAWVMQAFVTIVILGFPIALVLAWAFEISPDGVRRTRAATANEPIASTGSIVGYVVTATLAGAIGAGSFWMLSRDSDAEWFHAVAIPEIERHIAVGDWAAAFEVTSQAQARIGDTADSEFAEIWPRLSWTATIDSEPQGAAVFVRPYDAGDDGQHRRFV
jgi:hypothetical protein